MSPVSVVIPNWNGRHWLSGCLAALEAQDHRADEVIVVDNGSTDGSRELLAAEHPDARVIALPGNSGFAAAANRGIEAARGDLVALLNTDVVLAPDWLGRMTAALAVHPEAASVACKMVALDAPGTVYDAGDILRRDGACEQRGRYEADDGRFDEAGEVFGACAGAALYRRTALVAIGGFDEAYFAYLEDVDLALRLRLAGYGCVYEPAIARHAGEGSSHQLSGGHQRWVARNTIRLVAKAFPVRWLGWVAYRQLGWTWHALRAGTLPNHLVGLRAGLAQLPDALRARQSVRAATRVPIAIVIPPRPIRGPGAGGHPSRHAGQVPGSSRPSTR